MKGVESYFGNLWLEFSSILSLLGFFLLLPISWIKGISRGNVCWVQSLYEQKIFYTSAISLVRIQENILWNNKQNFEYRAGDIFYGASYWVILGEAADMLSFFLLLLLEGELGASSNLALWSTSDFDTLIVKATLKNVFWRHLNPFYRKWANGWFFLLSKQRSRFWVFGGERVCRENGRVFFEYALWLETAND